MADFEDTDTQPVSEAGPSPEELLLGGDKKERLGPWCATAICGNDITSSCLYVSAIAIVYAGATDTVCRCRLSENSAVTIHTIECCALHLVFHKAIAMHG